MRPSSSSRCQRLLYLTYQENILGSGILHTQVVGMLECLASLSGIQSVTLLSYMSPQLLWRERRGFKDLRQRLAARGIRLIRLPMIVPGRAKLLWWLPFMLWALPTFIVALITRCQVLHARSYPAAVLAWAATRLIRAEFVFDPRGPFPDEMVMNDIWKEGSLTHRWWRRIEDLLIASAGAVVGVTPEYRDEYRGRGARRAVFVPNRTDAQPFIQAARKAQLPERKLSGEGCELLFTGELHSVWNDPALVGWHFQALRRRYPGFRLRMITSARTDQAERALRELGVDLSRVTFESHRPADMPGAVQGAALGLIFKTKPIHSVWMVKMAEYLAAGIPILADRTMVGLPLQIILKRRLGVQADPDRPEDYAAVDDIITNWQAWSDRCREYAAKRLDISSTARQHLRIYRRLV
ncbi:MAG: glycosyltransferase [Calditrichota bacterium]